MIREPIAAGRFYPGSSSALETTIKKLVDTKQARQEVIGVILPHAGYIYSGAVAGAVISQIKLTDTVVIMGPNHTGYGKFFSIMTEGSWKTPLGNVEIDSKLAKSILANSKHLEEDEIAHIYEHSIEVQLPFLQYFNKNVKFVPIVLSHGHRAVYKEIGRSIAKAIKESQSEILIIASSDMTHYESQESARKKDTAAINAILELNEDELINQIQKLDITMCGYAPAVSLITAAKELGASRGELIKYQTSGDASGDYSSVVGYAGIVLRR